MSSAVSKSQQAREISVPRKLQGSLNIFLPPEKEMVAGEVPDTLRHAFWREAADEYSKRSTISPPPDLSGRGGNASAPKEAAIMVTAKKTEILLLLIITIPKG
jgi:hypothetical protein